MDLTQRLFADAFRDMQRAMSLFDEPFFNVGPGNTILGSHKGLSNNFVRYPATDMVEHPESYELHAELPGYDKKDLKVNLVDDRTLVLSGSVNQEYESSIVTSSGDDEKKAGEGAASTMKDDQGQQVIKKDSESRVTQYSAAPQWWYNERVSGSFSRTFSFPTPIKKDGIKASYQNGVLKVIVPKAGENGSKQIDID